MLLEIVSQNPTTSKPFTRDDDAQFPFLTMPTSQTNFVTRVFFM